MLNAAARPPDGVAAALRRHKPAIIALLSSTPSLPVTEEWLSVIGRLHPRCNPGCHCTADGWATFLNDARRFLDGSWGRQGAEHLFVV